MSQEQNPAPIESAWTALEKIGLGFLLVLGLVPFAFAIYAVVRYFQSFETFFPAMEVQVPVDTSEGSIAVKQADSVSDLRGQFGTLGDVMGGLLNPVLTFATFIVLIATILIQLKELRLTREELKNSNKMLEMSQKEQAKTARALKEQERTQRIQKFESTFFSLYDRIMSEQIRLAPVFMDAISQGLYRSLDDLNAEGFCNRVITHNREVSSFLILVYQAMKLVDDFSLSGRTIYEVSFATHEDLKMNEHEMLESKKKCFNILRASLSNDVLYLLFINCSRKNLSFGADFYKYRGYLDGYRFLEHLDLGDFISDVKPFAALGISDELGEDEDAKQKRIVFSKNTPYLSRFYQSIIKDYDYAFGDSVYIDKFR